VAAEASLVKIEKMMGRDRARPITKRSLPVHIPLKNGLNNQRSKERKSRSQGKKQRAESKGKGQRWL
jgi:hypothetical protein